MDVRSALFDGHCDDNVSEAFAVCGKLPEWGGVNYWKRFGKMPLSGTIKTALSKCIKEHKAKSSTVPAEVTAAFPMPVMKTRTPDMPLYRDNFYSVITRLLKFGFDDL